MFHNKWQDMEPTFTSVVFQKIKCTAKWDSISSEINTTSVKHIQYKVIDIKRNTKRGGYIFLYMLKYFLQNNSSIYIQCTKRTGKRLASLLLSWFDIKIFRDFKWNKKLRVIFTPFIHYHIHLTARNMHIIAFDMKKKNTEKPYESLLLRCWESLHLDYILGVL